MAKATFKYAEQSDLRQVFPEYGKYLSRRQIYDFVDGGSNSWTAYSVGTTPGVVFFSGREGQVVDPPASERDWVYDDEADALSLYTTVDPNDDQIIEVGQDKDTHVNQMLVNASAELNGMIDSRFPRPLPKAYLYSDAPSTDTPEYDPIIIRGTCLIAIKNMAITARDYDTAENIYKEISNENDTGIIDRLNDGKLKLAFEVDSTDKNGDIIEITRAGTMYLVETAGEFSGALYDRIQCICTTGGVYGTAEISVKVYDGNELYGSVTENVIITGGLQAIANGIYARWQGNSMSVDDRWDIEVRSINLPETNSQIKTIQLSK